MVSRHIITTYFNDTFSRRFFRTLFWYTFFFFFFSGRFLRYQDASLLCSTTLVQDAVSGRYFGVLHDTCPGRCFRTPFRCAPRHLSRTLFQDAISVCSTTLLQDAVSGRHFGVFHDAPKILMTLFHDAQNFHDAVSGRWGSVVKIFYLA